MTTASALGIQAAARFKDPDNRVISAAQWISYLNQAYKKGNTSSPLLPWNQSAEETVTVLANTRSIALPTNVFQVNWVYDNTNDKLLRDVQEVGEQWRSLLRSDTADHPDFYRIRNGVVELYPTVTTATSLRIECIEYPAELSAVTTTRTSVTGAAAGDLTVAGIAVGDTLLYVLKCVTGAPPTITDLTSEFLVTATNTINNTGGTTTAAAKVAVGYTHQAGSGSPVWPAAYHEDLIDGMLALAYLDDGSAEQFAAHQKAFDQSVAKMNQAMLMFDSQHNPAIIDDFFG